MTWQQTDPPAPWDYDKFTWMSQLDDSLAIQDLSIPGTHDSAAKKGLVGTTTSERSETQSLTIQEQLNIGVRFLDLRVKIMFESKGLAMYHAGDPVYDPEPGAGKLDQYYFSAVLKTCYDFLLAHDHETIIISLKSEGDTKYDGSTIEDWFRKIATDVAAQLSPSKTFDDMWVVRSDVNATLHDVRGKMVLWRRFPHEGTDPTVDYTVPFGLDLTPLNDKYDNTGGAGWLTPVGGYVFVQDAYNEFSASPDKAALWLNALKGAYDSRCDPANADANRQYINFLSIGKFAHFPETYAEVMNPLMFQWFLALQQPEPLWNAPRARSGVGVIPMDFVESGLTERLILMNFSWTYKSYETQGGRDAWDMLVAKFCTL